MKYPPFFRCVVVLTATFACCGLHPRAYAKTTQKKTTAASKAIVAMQGRAGKVALGDSVEQAKKAFPAPKGAEVGEARNYAMFQRDGWSWSTEKPQEAFEVSLKKGRVVGIMRTIIMPDEAARKKFIEQTIQKIGAPTRKAVGKTATIYAWDAKPNARFLVEMRQGFLANEPTIMAMVGDQDELKMFNYRVDDLKTTVKQLDMSAEAMKNLSKK